MIGSFLTRGLVMIFGYVYPAYECFKTVEKNKPDIEHLRFWCQYWILVAVLTVSERIGDAFVSWVPMYSEAKLAFYIYLWYPKTMGTTYVYDSFFRPYVAKHELEIDRNLLELRTKAGDMVVLYWQRAASYGQTRVFDILQYVAAQSTPRPRQVQPQQQGARVRPPTAPPTQQQPQVPPSPTSSASSSSQHQQDSAEKDKSPEAPAPASSAALSSQKTNVNPSDKSDKETSTQPLLLSEAESSMQIDSASSTGNEIANPLPKETILDETIRVTRGKLRKHRSAPTR